MHTKRRNVLTTIASAASAALGAVTSVSFQHAGVAVRAAAGTVNRVSIDYQVTDHIEGNNVRYSHFITDTAGVLTANQEIRCYNDSSTTAECDDSGTGAGVPAGTTGTGETITVHLGDGPDAFSSTNVGDTYVYGGSGNDTLESISRPTLEGP